MYYVSTKGGGGGPAKCLLLLTWGEGGGKTLAYVIIFCNFFRAAREMIINIQLRFSEALLLKLPSEI